MTDLSVTGNDRIFDGANMRPFDAHKTNIDDLFEEAQAWLTGEGVTSAEEAKAVETLLDLAREAKKAADESRKLENEPFDTGKAEVQARYNPVLKRADTIADTCKQALAPWRMKVEAEKQEKAEAARAEAAKLAQEAQDKLRASAGNVVERERAEEALTLAKDAAKFADRTTRKASTGNGLRTSYRAVLTDGVKAAEHYWGTRNADFQTFLSDLAAADVRRGVRSIPGFDVIEEKTAV